MKNLPLADIHSIFYSHVIFPEYRRFDIGNDKPSITIPVASWNPIKFSNTVSSCYKLMTTMVILQANRVSEMLLPYVAEVLRKEIWAIDEKLTQAFCNGGHMCIFYYQKKANGNLQKCCFSYFSDISQ